MTITDTNDADRLARWRSGATIAMGIVLIATQSQRMDHGGAGQISWIITGLIAVIFVVWASGRFRRQGLRHILNHERSDASRGRSLTLAFWTMIAASNVCYAQTFFRITVPATRLR